MVDIALLSASILEALQPYLPIIATKAAEEAGKKVPEAIGKVWDTIQKKFNTKAPAKEALDDLLKSPNDADIQAAFQRQLKEILSEDQSWSADLADLLEVAADRHKASLVGGGAVAQGAGAKAVGRGGVIVEGNITGDIVTGKKNTAKSKKKYAK